MFSRLTSAEIREIFRMADEDLRAERAGRPRPKRFFDDWPSAHFSKKEIRDALDAAWNDTFRSE